MRLATVSPQQPACPYQRRIRLAGRLLEAAWGAGALQRPRLAALVRRAERMPQRRGEGPWREALRVLVESLESEAALNPLGLTFAHVQISRLLTQRERAERLWAAHPEIAAVPLPSPIVVLGQMRSGTTRLQRLLGCDPRLNHTRFYETTAPIAPAIDLRICGSWAQLALLDLFNPRLQAVHPSSARAVEEVFGLLAFSFYGAQFEAQWRIPGFTRWWEAQDRGWVYGEFRQLLQAIAWQRRAPAAPFVLKAPQFLEDLPELLAIFPDARLVAVSRDPGETVASTASLVWNQMSVQSDAVERDWIGAEWLRKTARREAASMRARANHPASAQIDVDFAAMNADWRGEMRRIYRFLGLELLPQVEAAMHAYLQRSEASGFRRHTYRARDFGLSPETMRQTVRPTGDAALAAR
jgi:hypothetical protein